MLKNLLRSAGWTEDRNQCKQNRAVEFWGRGA